jgi:hypothetical protein
MREKVGSDTISRRSALSFVGLIAALGLAILPPVLTASDAEAQTAGMKRRQARRAHRREKRHARRAHRRHPEGEAKPEEAKPH